MLQYRLIASHGQSAKAAAGESSLLLNRLMCAVAVAPTGWWKNVPSQQVMMLQYSLIASHSQSAKTAAGEVVCCQISSCMQQQWYQQVGTMEELLQSNNPSQQAMMLWYRLIASQGQHTKAAAGESSLLSNKQLHAAAVVPMGWHNGRATLE